MNREQIRVETASLKTEMKELIESYQRKKIDFVTLIDEKLSLVEQLKVIETEVAYEVATESNGNGKKAYSNETLRNAELQKRLKSIPEYETLKLQCDHLEKQERYLKAEVDLVEKRFRVLEQIVMLIGIESYLLASFYSELTHAER